MATTSGHHLTDVNMYKILGSGFRAPHQGQPKVSRPGAHAHSMDVAAVRLQALLRVAVKTSFCSHSPCRSSTRAGPRFSHHHKLHGTGSHAGPCLQQQQQQQQHWVLPPLLFRTTSAGRQTLTLLTTTTGLGTTPADNHLLFLDDLAS